MCDLFDSLQYYLNEEGIAALRAEYLRVSPHLTGMPQFNAKIQAAVRNARSHISCAARVALATILPHTRTDDGTVTVCVCVCARVCVCVCESVCMTAVRLHVSFALLRVAVMFMCIVLCSLRTAPPLLQIERTAI